MTRNSDDKMARTHTRMVKHEKRVAAMIEDPELTGDLLLIGIALARMIDLDGWGKGGPAKTTFEEIATGLFHPRRNVHYVVQAAIRDDIRRYEPAWDTWRGRCEAPIIVKYGVAGR